MVTEILAGRRLMLTGVTGFLGKVWLVHLLHHLPDARVVVVIRPRGKESAWERFEAMVDTSPVFRPLREAHGRGLGRWLGARIEVLAGDVERPLFGLGAAAVDASQIDAVVHCAGLTDFQPDPTRALAVNTLGAKHAADVARRAGARLLHVSTAFVAGMVSGEIPEALEVGVAPNGARFSPTEEIAALQEAIRTPRRDDRVERALTRARALGWPNLYTYTKGLAEHVVGGRRDVPVTIVRPSIVECARTFPFEGWNEGLNTAGPLAWLISTAFRELPTRPDNHFDVVPVDDVARGMTLILAALLRGEAAPVYHLAAGDANPLTFGRTVELTGLGMRRWTRRGGGTSADRLLRHLDPVPAPSGGILPVERLRGWLGAVRDGLDHVAKHEKLPLGATPWVTSARDRVDAWDLPLGRVAHMLELYRPFIHDHDYVFRTDRIRRLGAALPAEEGELSWVVPTIDWRWYWVDVEYPGLCTWSIPEIRGEVIPGDPPSGFRLEPPMRSMEPELRHAT